MPKTKSTSRKSKSTRSPEPAAVPDEEGPVPRKRNPGDRARQPLTEKEATDFVEQVARAAFDLKRDTPRGQKKVAFFDLQETTGLSRATLLRWAKLYMHLKGRLAKHLEEHGKTKMYFASYSSNPAKLIREVDLHEVSAEELRLLIRAKNPKHRKRVRKGKGKKTWFRRHEQWSLSSALRKTTTWLREDVERIVRFVDIENVKPLTVKDGKALRGFISHLSTFLTDVSTAVDAKLSQDKRLIKRSKKLKSKGSSENKSDIALTNSRS